MGCEPWEGQTTSQTLAKLSEPCSCMRPPAAAPDTRHELKPWDGNPGMGPVEGYLRKVARIEQTIAVVLPGAARGAANAARFAMRSLPPPRAPVPPAAASAPTRSYAPSVPPVTPPRPAAPHTPTSDIDPTCKVGVDCTKTSLVGLMLPERMGGEPSAASRDQARGRDAFIPAWDKARSR